MDPAQLEDAIARSGSVAAFERRRLAPAFARAQARLGVPVEQRRGISLSFRGPRAAKAASRYLAARAEGCEYAINGDVLLHAHQGGDAVLRAALEEVVGGGGGGGLRAGGGGEEKEQDAKVGETPALPPAPTDVRVVEPKELSTIDLLSLGVVATVVTPDSELRAFIKSIAKRKPSEDSMSELARGLDPQATNEDVRALAQRLVRPGAADLERRALRIGSRSPAAAVAVLDALALAARQTEAQVRSMDRVLGAVVEASERTLEAVKPGELDPKDVGRMRGCLAEVQRVRVQVDKDLERAFQEETETLTRTAFPGPRQALEQALGYAKANPLRAAGAVVLSAAAVAALVAVVRSALLVDRLRKADFRFVRGTEEVPTLGSEDDEQETACSSLSLKADTIIDHLKAFRNMYLENFGGFGSEVLARLTAGRVVSTFSKFLQALQGSEAARAGFLIVLLTGLKGKDNKPLLVDPVACLAASETNTLRQLGKRLRKIVVRVAKDGANNEGAAKLQLVTPDWMDLSKELPPRARAVTDAMQKLPLKLQVHA